MRIKKSFIIILSGCISILFSCTSEKNDVLSYINPFLGTSTGYANLIPVASAPYGMVQLGADTRLGGPGYKIEDSEILGFSHTHMSGGGCNDHKDVMFLPQSNPEWKNRAIYPQMVSESFSHDKEIAEAAYYMVDLLNSNIEVELTATKRCGMHHYTYLGDGPQQVIIDMKHGNIGGCTVCREYNYDTIRVSEIEIVDDYSIKGFRITDGWLDGVTANFYAEFSRPFKSVQCYKNRRLIEGATKIEGADLRLVIEFDETESTELMARVGISPVDTEGAKKNLAAEIDTWDFDKVKEETQESWEHELSAIQVEDENQNNKNLFYTMLYRSLFYPQLYSDVDNRFRGSDNEVHQGDFDYYGGTMSLWDQFRAHQPLVSLLRPDVTNDLIKTFIEHYKHSGQLPQWTGAGMENLCMIGLPAHSIVADAYSKGLRDYDVDKIYEAMVVSANVDTFGFSKGNCMYKGTWLYKDYGYIPYELDINSVSKSVEFNYNDWSLAQMAKMLGEKDDYENFIDRASWYKAYFDPGTNLLRPKDANGEFLTPFDPVFVNHYHEGDHYCEGTAYQWTFFVPHDPLGLAQLMGGKEVFVEQLDSLFIRSSEVHSGGRTGKAMIKEGMIGQYAHSNEPSHHTIYMYNSVGQPWKTQYWINKVVKDLYKNTYQGFSGNEDCGQMAAWYVFSSMGFYPVTHGTGVYFIGTPSFENLSLMHEKGELNVKANNLSEENMYIQSLTLNSKPYNKSWFKHEDIFSDDVTLEFEMGSEPNKKWGSSEELLPPSMINERY